MFALLHLVWRAVSLSRKVGSWVYAFTSFPTPPYEPCGASVGSGATFGSWTLSIDGEKSWDDLYWGERRRI